MPSTALGENQTSTQFCSGLQTQATSLPDGSHTFHVKIKASSKTKTPDLAGDDCTQEPDHLAGRQHDKRLLEGPVGSTDERTWYPDDVWKEGS